MRRPEDDLRRLEVRWLASGIDPTKAVEASLRWSVRLALQLAPCPQAAWSMILASVAAEAQAELLELVDAEQEGSGAYPPPRLRTLAPDGEEAESE